jgi:hydrogenase expression/formation protein HypE
LKLSSPRLPVGKLPVDLLARLLAKAPIKDKRLLLGPGVGLDCAIVDLGSTLLVFKSDPITFTTEEIGWYAVQVNANDIATSGASPSWFLMTLLLPEDSTTSELVEQISQQAFEACERIGVTVIGGHTEITYGLDRPILVGTLIGEVERQRLITPRGAKPGDRLLLTKGVPIEAISILGREFPDRLRDHLTPDEITRARNYLYDPGISVLQDARLSTQAGRVTAMHDPTEGGLSAALWELAEACGHTLIFDPQAVPIPPLAKRICQVFAVDPLSAIASGALLLTTQADDVGNIIQTLESNRIPCAEIGWVEDGGAMVWRVTDEGKEQLPRPTRDEIARIYDS